MLGLIGVEMLNSWEFDFYKSFGNFPDIIHIEREEIVDQLIKFSWRVCLQCYVLGFFPIQLFFSEF